MHPRPDEVEVNNPELSRWLWGDFWLWFSKWISEGSKSFVHIRRLSLWNYCIGWSEPWMLQHEKITQNSLKLKQTIRLRLRRAVIKCNTNTRFVMCRILERENRASAYFSKVWRKRKKGGKRWLTCRTVAPLANSHSRAVWSELAIRPKRKFLSVYGISYNMPLRIEVSEDLPETK